ncbi:hypothetical protein CIHG_04346 [Coccidioides immitis H538.4]|nr:hypothetical protein CIRG_09279 [Coccidioides immitis RMSCC 2394]KMU86557.1 hypothetical protein CIHG_04346 [Coccidioides immitis H538.4]TPX24881.1 tRNA-specific adenosine deaminase subunit tad3 [Coccidioides immitis]
MMSAIKIGDSLKHIQPIIGRLVPLPTVQELHPTLEDAEAFVAEIDIKSANKVVKLLDSKFPRDPSLNLAYLRRFAKREHLPDHLKQPQEENGLSEPTSNRAKTIHVLISPPLPDRAELATLLAPHTTTSTGSILSDGAEAPSSAVQLRSTRIPLQPPTSLEQAQQWSRKYWPTVYNPAAQPASHSPPPTILSRTQASIKPPAGFYLALARKLAEEAEQSGRGRAVGAVVVDPAILESSLDEPLSAVVAAAGDSRYHDPNQRSPPPAAPNEPTTTNNSDDQPYHPDSEGQPSDHALMRVISLISHKRLTIPPAASTSNPPNPQPDPPQNPKPLPPEAQPLLHPPLSPLESHFFNTANLSPPSGGGYLCTSLDVYVTHEPCLCCAMGMLLSRFRTVVVGRRARGSELASLDAERGYGLHWRRELNWRAMGFEFVEEGVEDEDEDGGASDGFGFHA